MIHWWSRLFQRKALILAYWNFYNVPRVFLVRDGNYAVFFLSQFEEAKDDYADDYTIYSAEEFEDASLEEHLKNLAEGKLRELGRIPVHEVNFDKTKRKWIRQSVLARIRTES